MQERYLQCNKFIVNFYLFGEEVSPDSSFVLCRESFVHELNKKLQRYLAHNKKKKNDVPGPSATFYRLW
jgi:hypothetical protein